MPRKSAALRLSQAQKLYEDYTEASIQDDRSGRFVRDMILRLERGKGLSQGQRRWLDSLIDEGVPQPKGDQVLLAKIDEAIQTPGMEPKHQVLSDFRRKVFNGWNLSVKQAAWLSKMLADADDLRVNGPWRPSEENISIMRDLIALSRGYSTVYWQTHGGTYRAVEKIRDYIAVIDSEMTDETARNQALAKIGLDEWSINKAKKSMRGRLAELREKPYVVAGDLVWTRFRPEGASWNDLQWFRAPVCGDPEVSDRGQVVYPVLNPALGLILVSKDELAKRKPQGV